MSATDQSRRRSNRIRKLLPSLLVNAVFPFALYLVVRPFVPSDMIALLAGVCVPVVVTIIGFVVRRRFDRIGLLSVAAFAVLIALFAVTGGNPLILKLHEAIITGPLGLVGLGSVVIGKPLLGLIPPIRGTMSKRQLTAMTVIIGGTLVLHCIVVLGFAILLPTGAFLAVGRPVAFAVILAGLLAMHAYRVQVKKSGRVSAQPGD